MTGHMATAILMAGELLLLLLLLLAWPASSVLCTDSTGWFLDSRVWFLRFPSLSIASARAVGSF
jgi:hypothetical protein